MGQNVIETRQAQSAGAPSNSTVGTANATLFTLTKGEVGFIQNLDDAALHVKLGAGCSTSDYSLILQAGDAAADGKGGHIYIDDYEGVVSVCAATGTASYMAWKRVVA